MGKILLNGKEYTGGGGDGNLADLGDVDITTPTSGQVLRYNGTSWENGATDISPFSVVNGKLCITYKREVE